MGKGKQINSIEEMVEWMNGDFDLDMRITRVVKNGMIRLENLPTFGTTKYHAFTGTSHQAISFLGTIKREMEKKMKMDKKAQKGTDKTADKGQNENNQEESPGKEEADDGKESEEEKEG